MIRDMWPSKSKNLAYAHPNRLADVMALIQVLALHEFGDRSEKGLKTEMQALPRSASNWKKIAQEHPEFFRVDDTRRLGVSLVARHVLLKDQGGSRELSPEFTSILLKTAIDLHDRQIARAHPWRPYMNTFITGFVVIAAALLGAYYTQIWTADREIKTRNHEKRQIVYSELMGINIARRHLITAHTQAKIELEYHRQVAGMGLPKELTMVVLDAGRNAQKNANEYLIEITKKDQKLFELLGLVKILFPASPELGKKIDRIYRAKYPEIIPPKEKVNLPQIQGWRDKGFKEAQQLIAKEYGEPMEDLLSYLSNYLK
jgi:hypothetical protein